MKNKYDSIPYKEWPLYKRIDWTTTLFLILTPLAAIIWAPVHVYNFGLETKIIILFIVYSILTTLSIGSGYHRLYSHRAYETNRFIKAMWLFLAAAQFQGSALKWGSDHRRHHKYIDTENDPYNINKGFFYAHMGWLFFNTDPKNTPPFEKDLERDPLVAFQHRYYVPLAIFAGFILPMGIGALMGSPFSGLLWAGLVRVVFTQHTTFFINSLAHTWGRKPYELGNSARDSHIVAFFTYGEGYHNYHHKFQGDYRNGIHWFDWDPNKWVIRSLSFIGMAKGLKTIPANEILKARLITQEKILLDRGVPAEKLQYLRERVHAAQTSLRKIGEEYQAMKATWNSQEQVQRMKAEFAIAKLEFKMAYRQWKAYYRALRA